jgi:hypothetical protein
MEEFLWVGSKPVYSMRYQFDDNVILIGKQSLSRWASFNHAAFYKR